MNQLDQGNLVDLLRQLLPLDLVVLWVLGVLVVLDCLGFLKFTRAHVKIANVLSHLDTHLWLYNVQFSLVKCCTLKLSTNLSFHGDQLVLGILVVLVSLLLREDLFVLVYHSDQGNL